MLEKNTKNKRAMLCNNCETLKPLKEFKLHSVTSKYPNCRKCEAKIYFNNKSHAPLYKFHFDLVELG
jgi:hypothetical protein